MVKVFAYLTSMDCSEAKFKTCLFSMALLSWTESLLCAQVFTPAISNSYISYIRPIISLSDKETETEEVLQLETYGTWVLN